MKRQSTFSFEELKNKPEEVDSGIQFEVESSLETRRHPAGLAKPVVRGLPDRAGNNLVTDSQTGERLYQGMPFRGEMYPLKDDDPEHLKPQRGNEVHINVFETWEKGHLEKYEKICQKVVQNHAVISFEERMPVPEKNGWRIMIRWFDKFYQPPKAVQIHRS